MQSSAVQAPAARTTPGARGPDGDTDHTIHRLRVAPGLTEVRVCRVVAKMPEIRGSKDKPGLPPPPIPPPFPRSPACGDRIHAVDKPGFPRWLGRFGMAFAPFPRKTQRFPRLPAETTEEPNG